jgi:sulfur-oxidizing protein SoxX
MKKLTAIAGCVLAAGCVTQQADTGSGLNTEAIFKAGFSQGNAALAARVSVQDDVQTQCSKFRDKPSKEIAANIEKQQLSSVKFPEKLMGDWKKGEKIAQDGWGMRFTDMKDSNPNRPNGGNCYACHQIAPQELSYGTLGPSLYRFGALRGNSAEIQKYTWGKIANPQAYSACSNMPRFGHNKILTDEQISDLVALLLDPESPANK